MTYYLGIDLGTTYTAAAVWRDGRVEIASLGTRNPVVPSVVLLRDDGTILTGEAAARRAVTEPERIAREFKRRFGDPTPIMVGGTPYSPDALTARMLGWVVAHVTEREGEAPAGTAVSHPANWGPFKQDLLRQVFRLANLGRVTTTTEPEAAAIHYASQERVNSGDVVAVYDLGGGTFDAAVLRRTTGGWEVLGTPEGVERLGGIDFDQAVFHHVSNTIGDAADELDPTDPTAITAMARLRQECVDAKEALASDVDVTIPVLLPTIQTEVRLTRSELEGMIRPALADSISALRRALTSANVQPEDVRSVLLVGGSSRLPLVAQLVGSELRRPVAVDAHPKYGVALGAAIIAAERGTGRQVDTEIVPSIEHITPASAGAVLPTVARAVAPGEAPAGEAPTPDAAEPISATSPAPDAAAGDVDEPPTQPVPTAMPPTPPAPPPPTQPTQQPSPSGPPTQPVPVATAAPTEPSPAPPPPVQPAETESAAAGGASDSAPPSGIPSSSGSPSSRPVLAIVGGLIAAALLVVAGITLTNNNGDDDDTTTGDNETASNVSEVTTTTAPTTSATTAAPVLPAESVTLDGIDVVDGQYHVTYTWTGFDPIIIDGDLDSRHFHFFLDTTEPQNAGTNGNPAGDWELTDDPGDHVLAQYGPYNRGEATQMCSVVADGAHAVVDPASGNCLELPE
jgi:molecular chaperone DnaK